MILDDGFGVATEQNVGTAACHVGETVTAPLRPAWATINASRSWFLAFNTSCGTPIFLRIDESFSDFSTEMVPTRTGWPFSFLSLISLAALRNFSSSVR